MMVLDGCLLIIFTCNCQRLNVLYFPRKHWRTNSSLPTERKTEHRDVRFLHPGTIRFLVSWLHLSSSSYIHKICLQESSFTMIHSVFLTCLRRPGVSLWWFMVIIIHGPPGKYRITASCSNLQHTSWSIDFTLLPSNLKHRELAHPVWHRELPETLILLL